MSWTTSLSACPSIGWCIDPRCWPKATGRTKSFYAREAILQHLDDLEDRYLAEGKLEALRAGRLTSLPLAKVMQQPPGGC